ncbi:MAG: DUF2934 domain-containing protein [Paracoccaceae bacterium]
MKPRDFDAFDRRVQARAQKMWEEAGRPDGGAELFRERARDLLEISENPEAGRMSVAESTRPRINTLVDVENQGEMPGLTDQGDGQLFPDQQQSVDVPIPPEAKEPER